MTILYHFQLCPFSRRIRLALEEYGFEYELRPENPWERRKDFLALNPSGATPVMVEADGVVGGVYALTEFVEESVNIKGRDGGLFPDAFHERAEVRRLIAWFDEKFSAEVSAHLVHEKVVRRYLDAKHGGGAPNTASVRAAIHNIKVHLDYIGYLVERRKWLGGKQFSHADLAAAAHLSCIDYLGDVPWGHNGAAREWYARVKSRPSFRPLLADRLAGMPPPEIYADLDF